MSDDQQPIGTKILRGDTRPSAPVTPNRPWLAGDGQALRIGVLGVVAVLVAACIMLFAVMIARGTRWLHRQAPELSAPEPLAQQQEAAILRRAAEDAARQRSDDPGVAAARRPLGNPADWILPDDYPPSALRDNEEGTVRITWLAGPDGRVIACRATVSSGYADLDRAACNAIKRRGRYPAVDTAAAPRLFTRRVVWRIPG